MFILVEPINKDVVALSSKAILTKSGIDLDDGTYGISSDGENFVGVVPQVIQVTSYPTDFEHGKYRYDEIDGFYVSPVYTERVAAKIQQAIDEYTLSLIEGGLL